MKRLWYLGLLLSGSMFSAFHAQAEIQGSPVEYQLGDQVLKGFLAYDNAVKGTRPGILVVHEWWGHNEYARKRARMLAEQGYTALAVDMYGDGKQADHPDDASRFYQEVMNNLDVGAARFEAGMALLQHHETVNPENISAIGYCFGGAIVLEMARRGMDLDLVASFHGSLGTANPAQRGKINATILVFNGAEDPFVKPETIEAFEAEMSKAGVDYVLVNYPEAKHSFTNPEADANGKRFELPLAYHAEADRQSWSATLEELRRLYRE